MLTLNYRVLFFAVTRVWGDIDWAVAFAIPLHNPFEKSGGCYYFDGVLRQREQMHGLPVNNPLKVPSVISYDSLLNFQSRDGLQNWPLELKFRHHHCKQSTGRTNMLCSATSLRIRSAWDRIMWFDCLGQNWYLRYSGVCFTTIDCYGI